VRQAKIVPVALARWGEWHLADVWLDLPEPNAEQRGNSNAVLPGAKP
jgi:hypothetical protein